MLNRLVVGGRSSNKFRHSLLTRKTTTSAAACRPSISASYVLRSSSSSSSCRRRFFSATANNKGPQQRQQQQQQQSKVGNYLIKFGWLLLGVVTLDQALQYKQEREAKQHHDILRQMQHEANNENYVDWDMSLPTLFECRITHKEISLDGTKMLSNVKVGDIVEVMEASTGPNQAYHLCRIRRPRSRQQKRTNNHDRNNEESNNNNKKTTTMKVGDVGWYPIDYLQKI